MDLGDVKVTDEDGLLSWTNRVADQLFFSSSRPASEIGFQPLHPVTDALLRDEPNLHLESYRRSVTDGMQSSCPSC